MLQRLPRRAFLKALAASAGAAAVPTLAGAGQADGKAQGERASWQNWSGNQTARPRNLAYPADETALARLLANTEGTVRPFGGSHSFSAVVPTGDTLVSLEAINGLRSVDAGALRFGAGTRIAQAGSEAWGEGRSLINEPDINLQSLAGAIATGTHGTGLGLPCLSDQVVGLELMDTEGTLHRLDHKDGDRFQAARCGLGALGPSAKGPQV